MNAIDDIGQKVGVERDQTGAQCGTCRYNNCSLGCDHSCHKEGDHEYALRVLEKLYRTYQMVNAEGWLSFDRETNEYQLQTKTGSAYIARGPKSWMYCVYTHAGKRSDKVSEGTARYLEKAMQICSLALAP